MTLPWYPRDMGLYARDTKHLTMLEHGAYNLLLDYYYSNGPIALNSSISHMSNASFLLDHSRLHRICGAVTKSEQEAVDSVISMFFVKQNEFYRHKKADEVIDKQALKHENRVRAGKQAKMKQCSSNGTQKETKIKIEIKKDKDSNPKIPFKAPLTPQQSTGRDLKPAVSEEGRKFSIERVLSDSGRERAKLLCKSLNRDIYPLFQVYDSGINDSGRARPTSPDIAFYAWIKSYTKGERL